MQRFFLSLILGLSALHAADPMTVPIEARPRLVNRLDDEDFVRRRDSWLLSLRLEESEALRRPLWGLTVTKVNPGSQAAKKGVEIGDVLEALGGTPIATTEALKRVRSGDGPVFIEAMTYRFRGHSIADPAGYREAFEVDEWKTKDPISSFKNLALSEGLIDEAEIARIDAEVEATVEEAVRFAEESDDPSPESLYENVYG